MGIQGFRRYLRGCHASHSLSSDRAPRMACRAPTAIRGALDAVYAAWLDLYAASKALSAMSVALSATFLVSVAAFAIMASIAAPLDADDNGSQSINMPVPDSASHLLDVGDYILVQVSLGKEMQSYEVQLDAEGTIVLPLIGAVYVREMTGRDAADLLTSRYLKFYRNVYTSIQIRNYGQFEVFVFGPDFPGRTIKLNNGTRLLSLIASTDYDTVRQGAYRRLHLIRSGLDLAAAAKDNGSTSAIGRSTDVQLKPPPLSEPPIAGALAQMSNVSSWVKERLSDPKSRIYIIDPLALTRYGELSQFNYTLKDRDVIFIPTPERYVDISGVILFGRYELLGDETLGAILRLAGSANFNSDLANTIIQRYDDEGKLTQVVVNLLPALDDASFIASYPLQNRDNIQIIAREKRVFVLGEVNLAGAFPYAPQSTILDYIAQAGGETERAHLTWIAVIRQSRSIAEPGAAPEVFQIDFKDLHAGRESAAIALLPGDIIYVPPKGYEFRIQDILTPLNTLMSGYAISQK
jgi:protein involved in polysaccharide export with SLBB domain